MDPLSATAQATRHATGADLAEALQACRRDTLALFAAYEQALPDLQVPGLPELNPPLWELGHIGWFAQRWIARNPQRARGPQADPQAPRGPARRPDADALYDSTTVAHATRWTLPLPDTAATRADLAAQLDETLDLLAGLPDADDDALYFFRLALAHEDMHHEAFLYMAQTLGLPVGDARWSCPRLGAPSAPLPLPGGPLVLGRPLDAPGFAFDNEYGQQALTLAPATIDAQVLRWRDYLPFVEDGGYTQAAWWSAAGWRWREARGLRAPRDLDGAAGAWSHRRHGRRQALDPDEPACHLSLHEAQAWCRWAGRRLPTEAEWVQAVRLHGAAFHWGAVWEWTATPFAPFPGFRPHPYREYSAPWFDGRPVLRGASFMTQPRMRHADYRNFFEAARHDVPAGFRTCSA